MNGWGGFAWQLFKVVVAGAAGLFAGTLLVAVALAAYHTWLS